MVASGMLANEVDTGKRMNNTNKRERSIPDDEISMNDNDATGGGGGSENDDDDDGPIMRPQKKKAKLSIIDDDSDDDWMLASCLSYY